MEQCYLIDFVIAFMIAIMIFIFSLIVVLIFNRCSIKYFCFSNRRLEFWCGVLPIIILLIQIFFSYNLLYYDSLITNSKMERFVEGPKIVVKVTGHQWF